MCVRIRGRKWTRSHMAFKGNEDVEGLSDGIREGSVEDGKTDRLALAHSSLVIWLQIGSKCSSRERN